MTLTELTIAIERRYPTRPTASPDSTIALCSGGEMTEDRSFPVICADEATAIRLYSDTFDSYAKAFDANTKGHGLHAKLFWKHRPEMMKFHVTIADERQTHRSAGIFYAVYSRLALI